MKKDITNITTYESGVMQSTAHRLTMKVKSEYLAQYDITPMQWFVIGYVYEAGADGIRLNDLRTIIDSTMPFITNTVNHLEAKGILHKVSKLDDSRVKIAKLNPKYTTLVEKIEAGLRTKLRQELYERDYITRDELITYISVIYKIAHDYEEDLAAS